MRQITLLAALAVAIIGAPSLVGQTQGPAAWWKFDDSLNGALRDEASQTTDTVSGNYSLVPGVTGKALKLDGYTTVVTRKADAAPTFVDAFTIEAWIALAAYPWNSTPVMDQRDEQLRGYALEIGPRGEVQFQVASDGRWLTATSADFAVPLKKWTHVAVRYARSDGLTLFVNGAVAAQGAGQSGAVDVGRRTPGRITMARSTDLLLGAVRKPERPSNWHRFDGNRPSWFSLDGLLDDVKIYTMALPAEAIARAFGTEQPQSNPEFASRTLPSGPPGPARFGAFYTNLAYYAEWDALWRVGPDADIVVKFDESPVRVVFWRGTQYSPAWVSEKNLWMSDQSVEGFNEGYTYEHMNDKQNRYSHVRIIENNDARVVVHWRYALVNVANEFWNITERLENGAWIDEYYYLYPDGAGVRHVSWKHDTLGKPVQFQESIVLTHPGQLEGDVINPEYATVGNLKGETQTLWFVEQPANPSTKTFPADLSIQMHNFKSQYKPFIAFEPGNRMGQLREMDIRALSRPSSSDHWPVAQVLSDGRTGQAADRPGHFLGFPISNPPLHEGKDGRDYWNGLYGMTNRPFQDVVTLARSWAAAPVLRVTAGDFSAAGYDPSERAYKLARASSANQGAPLRFEIAASAESPVSNLALVLENWGDADAALVVNGNAIARGPQFRYAHRYGLHGTDLIMWVKLQSNRPLQASLSAR
jgi:concanavalin A-like lectin/glucanase superfamily protein